MTDQTSAELERDAEKIRADLAQTAEAIQDKMSPGKIVDELMGYFKGSDGSVALDNLRRQVRDNPMALALIGSGAAWLMFGGGASSPATAEPSRSRGLDPYAAPDGLTPSPAERPLHFGGMSPLHSTEAGEGSGGLAEKASDFAHRAEETAGAASERLRDAAGDVREQLHDYGQDASATGRRAAESVRDYADSGRRSLSDALDREPLVLGAIGLAVGAALGAMLPGTRFEDETFGKTRDSLVREAGRAVDRAAENAHHVASEALAAARDASEKEGLTIEGKPVVERLGDVAKAAVAAGEEAAAIDQRTADSGTGQPDVSRDEETSRV